VIARLRLTRRCVLLGLCLSERLLSWLLGLHRIRSDDLLTVIFTSGSTGQPKGVMLTHGNVDHNVRCVEQVVRLTPRDVLLGILPFFHSFGYTVTMWPFWELT